MAPSRFAFALVSLFVLPSSATLSVPTLWWNSHYQCSEGTSGTHCYGGSATPTCTEKAKDAFVSLVTTAEAQVAAAIELFPNTSETQPYDFTRQGLDGFSQINGYCADSSYSDQLALLFASEWQVQASSGGCLGGSDSRAFAVAHVTPPMPVDNCDGLCVLAVHMPHGFPNQDAADVVQQVCGELTQQCAVVFGDWNAPEGSRTPDQVFTTLIGTSPSLVEPSDQNTCCYLCGGGAYDHLLTNIGGAAATSTVYDYQILDENPVEQHNPVSVALSLPSSCYSNSSIVGEPRRLKILV